MAVFRDGLSGRSAENSAICGELEAVVFIEGVIGNHHHHRRHQRGFVSAGTAAGPPEAEVNLRRGNALSAAVRYSFSIKPEFYDGVKSHHTYIMRCVRRRESHSGAERI